MLNFKTIIVSPFRQNCSVIYNTQTGNAAVIDPGGDTEKIMAFLSDNNLTLKHIWLTHGHLDHVGGVATLQQKTQATVNGPHIEDKFWIDALEEQIKRFGWKEYATTFTTDWLKHNDNIYLDNHAFTVLFCPGHTPGHVVFYNKTMSTVFTGDVLFYQSIGRTDFLKSNHEDLIKSIRQNLFTLPSNTVVVPGHGRKTTIGHETQYNPFLQNT